jgi:O-antigen ligase
MPNRSYHTAVNVLVFLLPVTAVWIRHAASATLILLALLGVHAWYAREQKLTFSWPEKAVMISFAAILGMGLLSVPLHWISPDNFQSDFQYGHEIKLLLFIPIYYLFVHTKLKAETFWYSLCAGAVFAGVWSLISYYMLGVERIEGAYHHIVFGDACMAMGFLSLAGIQFFERKHKLLVLIPIAAVLMGLTATFLAGVRGALIAGPLLLLVFLFQLGTHPRAWLLRTVIITVLLIGGGTAYTLTGSSLTERMQAAYQTVNNALSGQKISIMDSADPSTAARLRMWTEAVDIIREHPWIGVGDDGFEDIIDQKAQTDPTLRPITRYGTPHNMYLELMTIHGIPGLPVILALFLAPLTAFLLWLRRDKAVRDYAYAGIMLVLAFMQFALTEALMEKSIPIAIYGVYTAAAMALCRNTARSPASAGEGKMNT